MLCTGQPLFLPDRAALLAAYPTLESADIQACAVLPLVGSGNFRGSCLLGFETARWIGAEEQAVLLMMAAQLAVAMERAQLTESEHALTEALQKKLLPAHCPNSPRW